MRLAGTDSPRHCFYVCDSLKLSCRRPPAPLHAPAAPVRGRRRRHALVPRRPSSAACRSPSLSRPDRRPRGGRSASRLFERDRRRVLVTAAGRDLVDRARRILVELGRPARRRAAPLGPARRDAPRRRHPDDLALPAAGRDAGPPREVPAPHRRLGRGQDGGADGAARLGGASTRRSSRSRPSVGDFESEVVASDPFVLAAPPGRPARRGKGPARLSRAQGRRVLLLDDGHCFREQALEVCSRARAQELEVRATSLPTLVADGGAGTRSDASAAPGRRDGGRSRGARGPALRGAGAASHDRSHLAAGVALGRDAQESRRGAGGSVSAQPAGSRPGGRPDRRRQAPGMRDTPPFPPGVTRQLDSW